MNEIKPLQLTPETTKGLDIVVLFLQKLEMLNQKERAEIIKVIELLNKPLYLVA
jgi:hypothetical protein